MKEQVMLELYIHMGGKGNWPSTSCYERKAILDILNNQLCKQNTEAVEITLQRILL